MAKGIKRVLKKMIQHVRGQVRNLSEGGGMYARGIASEGYDGGYLQALSDVQIALNGVCPNQRYKSAREDAMNPREAPNAS